MTQFKYSVIGANNVQEKGAIQAKNKNEAVEALRAQGKKIINLVEVKPSSFSFLNQPHLSFQEKMMFAKHMSTMIRSGIAISEALGILTEQSKKGPNRTMFNDILQRVNSGQSLSESMREYPKVFSDVFVNMVATGEESGTLDESFEYLDKQLEKEYDLRKKVGSAFIYPAVIVGITLLLVVGIVVFIMPRIINIFSTFDVVLPLPTRIMIGFSSFIVENPLFTLLGVVTFVVGCIFLMKLKKVKAFFARVILYVPIFGKLLRNVNLSRFCQTFHSLLEAGVPITKTLAIVEASLSNEDFKQSVARVKAKVQEGGSLGEAFLPEEKLFPVMFTKMISVGERTGSLGSTVEHLSRLYEKSVDDMTKNLATLLEPILLVFMAGLVGAVAISIILPIYQLPNLIGR